MRMSTDERKRRILKLIATARIPPTHKEMAAAAGYGHQGYTTMRLVDALLAEGLIGREDGKPRAIWLTEAGQAEYARLEGQA